MTSRVSTTRDCCGLRFEIGLISDVGFARLDDIRFMRNHASAAHPNQNNLTGLELVTFLQLCIREVINTPTDTVTAHTGRLLGNTKKGSLIKPRSTRQWCSSDQSRPIGRHRRTAYRSLHSPDRTPMVADCPAALACLWPFVGTQRGAATACVMRVPSPAQRQHSRQPPRSDRSSERHRVPYNRSCRPHERGARPAQRRSPRLQQLLQRARSCASRSGPGRRRAMCPTWFVSATSMSSSTAFSERIRRQRCGRGVVREEAPSARFSSADAGVALRLFINPVYSSLLTSTVGADAVGAAPSGAGEKLDEHDFLTATHGGDRPSVQRKQPRSTSAGHQRQTAGGRQGVIVWVWVRPG